MPTGKRFAVVAVIISPPLFIPSLLLFLSLLSFLFPRGAVTLLVCTYPYLSLSVDALSNADAGGGINMRLVDMTLRIPVSQRE